MLVGLLPFPDKEKGCKRIIRMPLFTFMMVLCGIQAFLSGFTLRDLWRVHFLLSFLP